jgi:hypothetical protein
MVNSEIECGYAQSGEHVVRWRTFYPRIVLVMSGNMSQMIRCWKGWSTNRERDRKACGLIRSRCRRGSGESEPGVRRVAEIWSI